MGYFLAKELAEYWAESRRTHTRKKLKKRPIMPWGRILRAAMIELSPRSYTYTSMMGT